MARLVFYCHDERSNLDSFEYYKQDIDALRALGHEVVVCTRYREIPFRFDAMFAWWWTHALLPVVLCRMLGRPCIVTGTFNFRFPPDFEGRDYFHRPRWQRFLISAAVQGASQNLFVNQAEREACERHFRLANARYYPHIVHDDYTQGPSAPRKLALFNLAWSGRTNLIRKGIPELLRALRILKDQGVETHLYLAGPAGDGVDYLLGLIEELRLSDMVTCMGPLSRPDKITMLRTTEVYVQPSHYEGFGLAMAEAMGCGACVITCDVGAVRAVVGECGIYVAPGSPEELAAAIGLALSDTGIRVTMQRAAVERARSQFAVGTKLERLKGHLAEVGIT